MQRFPHTLANTALRTRTLAHPARLKTGREHESSSVRVVQQTRNVQEHQICALLNLYGILRLRILRLRIIMHTRGYTCI